MNEVPVWHCELKPLTMENGQPGPALAQLTVGAKFELECSGDIAVKWAGSPEITLPEKTPDQSLVLLQARKLDANAVDLVVTSYRSGNAKPEYVRLMDGNVGFEASGLEWTVQSVLKQGEEPKPYGPIGPFGLSAPMWIWILLALILAAVLGGVWSWFKRVQRRRNLRDELALHSQGLNPSAQFHKELRTLSRKLLQVKDTAEIGDWNTVLDRTLRIYLLRTFEVPAIKASRGEIMRGIRKKDRPAYDALGAGLKKVFSEMDRFQTHAGQHRTGDYEQILKIARDWCDQLEKRKAHRP